MHGAGKVNGKENIKKRNMLEGSNTVPKEMCKKLERQEKIIAQKLHTMLLREI